MLPNELQYADEVDKSMKSVLVKIFIGGVIVVLLSAAAYLYLKVHSSNPAMDVIEDVAQETVNSTSRRVTTENITGIETIVVDGADFPTSRAAEISDAESEATTFDGLSSSSVPNMLNISDEQVIGSEVYK